MTRLLALLMLMTLVGCGPSAKSFPNVPPAPRSSIPQLSSSDASQCRDPGVADGADAKVEIGRQRLALGECSRKHGRVVSQYQHVAKKYEGK